MACLPLAMSKSGGYLVQGAEESFRFASRDLWHPVPEVSPEVSSDSGRGSQEHPLFHGKACLTPD